MFNQISMIIEELAKLIDLATFEKENIRYTAGRILAEYLRIVENEQTCLIYLAAIAVWIACKLHIDELIDINDIQRANRKLRCIITNNMIFQGEIKMLTILEYDLFRHYAQVPNYVI